MLSGRRRGFPRNEAKRASDVGIMAPTFNRKQAIHHDISPFHDIHMGGSRLHLMPLLCNGGHQLRADPSQQFMPLSLSLVSTSPIVISAPQISSYVRLLRACVLAHSRLSKSFSGFVQLVSELLGWHGPDDAVLARAPSTPFRNLA